MFPRIVLLYDSELAQNLLKKSTGSFVRNAHVCAGTRVEKETSATMIN